MAYRAARHETLPVRVKFAKDRNGTEMMVLIQSGLDSLAAMAAMIPLQPPVASTIAGGVDQLYLLLSGITAFFTVLIFILILHECETSVWHPC